MRKQVQFVLSFAPFLFDPGRLSLYKLFKISFWPHDTIALVPLFTDWGGSGKQGEVRRCAGC